MQKKEKTEKGSTKPLKINVIRLKILKSVVHKLLIDNYSNGFAEKLQQKWKLSKSEELWILNAAMVSRVAANKNFFLYGLVVLLYFRYV